MEEVTDEPLYRDRVCGIDIGKAELYATIRVPSDKDPARRASETRRFAATKRGVLALADWLRCWQVPAVVMEATLVIRGSNGLKSDIAQVVPSRTRPRREGQKRQRREAVAGPAPRSAVCVAEGPQVTRPRQNEERANRHRHRPSRTPAGDPGLRVTTRRGRSTGWRPRGSSASWPTPSRSSTCPAAPSGTRRTPAGWPSALSAARSGPASCRTRSSASSGCTPAAGGT